MRRKPVVGVIGNWHRLEGRFDVQAVGERNLRAIAEVADALPLVFAGCPEITDVAALLDVVDGIVLTGARANVHPARFKSAPDAKHEPYDILRDDVALLLLIVVGAIVYAGSILALFGPGWLRSLVRS